MDAGGRADRCSPTPTLLMAGLETCPALMTHRVARAPHRHRRKGLAPRGFRRHL